MNFTAQQSKTGYLKDKDKQETKRPILKIQQDQTSIQIQTENIAIQAIFTSPILKVLEYLQQYQKYNYRAALSGINLKVEEYDSYYAGTKERVETLYNTLAYKSMKIIEDLLISLKVAKVECWRQHAMTAHLLKTNLYQRHNTCPYNFNSKQFQPDLNQVLTFVSQNKTKTTEITKIITELSKKMKDIQASKMQQMFSGKVISPYLAQNKYSDEINPSKMYSYFNKSLQIKMQRYDKSTLHKFSMINEQILKYTQYLYEKNIRAQKFAINMIKRYNDQYALTQAYKDYISPPPFLTYKTKFGIEQDCLHSGKQKWSQLKLAITNRQYKLEFKGFNRVVDMQTSNEEILEHKEQDERPHGMRQEQKSKLIYGYNANVAKHQPFQYFDQQKKINSREFYYYKQFQKPKRRDQQMYFNQKYRQRQASLINLKNRKALKVHSHSNYWTQYFQYQYAFSQLYLQRIERQQYKQQHRSRDDVEKRFQGYRSQKVKSQASSNSRIGQNKLKSEALMKKISQQQAILQQTQRKQYQTRKRNEQKQRITRFNHLYKKRTYESFMMMSKLQPQKDKNIDLQQRGQFIHKYGLIIMKNLRDETNFKEVDKFFYYYFKQKYYRENESIKENADNPIVFLDAIKVNMDASEKIVGQLINSIVKRIATMPFFIIWSQDLLVYKLIESKEEKYGEIMVYPLVNCLNMQKLVYEIRRRVKINLKQTFFNDYNAQLGKVDSTQLQKIASKVQITHRTIYQRHLPYKILKNSIQKGQELLTQIIQQLQT